MKMYNDENMQGFLRILLFVEIFDNVWIVIRYVGETSRSIDKRIYKNKRHLKRVYINNDIVKYNLEINHNFNFKDSKMLVYIQN